MNNINGNFTEKTFDPNKTIIKINPGGGEIEMLFKYIIEVINNSNGGFLKTDSAISDILQSIKDNANNISCLQISTDTILITTPASAPFKIKAKDTSGAQFDLEAFSDVGSEYLGLRMRGTSNQYLSQFYYFRSLSGQDYAAIQVNLTDLMQFINESGVVETLIPTGNLGIGVSKNGTPGSTNIHPSAKVQIDSITQGVLLPRMTTAQINAIVSPATGLEVYNTTLKAKCFYDGAIWNKLTHSAM